MRSPKSRKAAGAERASPQRLSRLLYSTTPARLVFPYVGRQYVADKVADDSDVRELGDQAVELARITPASFAEQLAGMNLSLAHVLCWDLACGLYGAYSSNFRLCVHSHRVDPETRRASHTVFKLDVDEVYRLLFGPLIRPNGRAHSVARGVLDRLKRDFKPTLTGAVPPPRFYASIAKNKKTGQPPIFVHGAPIAFKLAPDKSFLVTIDHAFFPLVGHTNARRVGKDPYLTQIAGLTAFLSLGRHLLKSRKSTGATRSRRVPHLSYPQVPDPHRLITAVQAVHRLHVPGVEKKSWDGMRKFVFARSWMSELRPDAVGDRPRLTEFREFLTSTCTMFRAGLLATDAYHEYPAEAVIPVTSIKQIIPELKSLSVLIDVED